MEERPHNRCCCCVALETILKVHIEQYEYLKVLIEQYEFLINFVHFFATEFIIECKPQALQIHQDKNLEWLL